MNLPVPVRNALSTHAKLLKRKVLLPAFSNIIHRIALPDLTLLESEDGAYRKIATRIRAEISGFDS
jgi:hypothetical protein